ncbi:Asp23/Gls24 family envelope stress response protein [Epidermidibacterium keratini]|uniref:Asp23/Gls24 family envelope stress response protein n=1 Tax=Epidermidibacterium keratini TaxID=1891644 RepID=A0A7L4YSN4_9ACTN|nr:Asp23/Gls24 family envelope stress response protein [Epidermidibacterium keratini]QHC01983.1 Asp23/Gls24 family envelope stress response protein [Epidermidibacterium keratini]
MTAPAMSSTTGEPVSSDPASRGLTRVSPHVVERIATHACASVPGTVTPRTAPPEVTAPPPRARADVSGRHAHLSVTVGMSYARPIANVATEVRRHVSADVERLCGMQVVGVDVEAVPIHTMRRSRVR